MWHGGNRATHDMLPDFEWIRLEKALPTAPYLLGASPRPVLRRAMTEHGRDEGLRASWPVFWHVHM